ncbi:MFS transporter [Chamaesiphon polymorphus]|uniref:MFS transporter n=1 Tax=Chamaesiphon polymorphus TaxID=2107691 RepID=UPI001FE37C8B|nr:MFS transporter [Chamaesiphon polymorphus]
MNYAWVAFFLTFVVWFNYAPFVTVIREELHLTIAQSRTISLCNLALTIPARIIIGTILDRLGPRVTFSAILIYAALPCWAFAGAQNFSQLVLSRLAMGIVGAGFVVGVRLVGDWFESDDIGLAQGIYGGWGNFGSFASQAFLPIVALANAGFENWRLAIALSGLISLGFGVLFYLNVQNTPPGKRYQRSDRGGMEVTSRASFWVLTLTNLPLFLVLGSIAWRLQLVNFLTPHTMYQIWLFLVGLFFLQTYHTFEINREVILGQTIYPAKDRYQIGQLFILELAYAVSFGSELAVVSMLPEYFEETFNLGRQIASLVAATYPLMNLVARPAGGLISDKSGSRKWALTLTIGGVGLSYLMMSKINPSMGLPWAILLTMFCAFFVFAGAGATFGIAPLIERRVTGQIAGNISAYGSVGSVLYAMTYSLLPQTVAGNNAFFQIIGVTGMVVACLCALLLKEPKVAKGDAESVTISR